MDTKKTSYAITVASGLMLAGGLVAWAMLVMRVVEPRSPFVTAGITPALIVGSLALPIFQEIRERRRDGSAIVNAAMRGTRGTRMGIALIGMAVFLLVPFAGCMVVLARANENAEFISLKGKYFPADDVCHIAMDGGRSEDLRIAANCARGLLAARASAVFGSSAAIAAWLGLLLYSRRRG